MKGRPWTTGELRVLREHGNETAASIAARLDRTPAAVANMARRQGIELAPMPGISYPEGMRRRAQFLRQQRKVPVREIASRFGVSHGWVSKWTRETA